MRPLPAILVGSLALLACSKNEPANSTATATATATATPTATPTATATPTPTATGRGALASALHPDLLDPSKASAKAPDVFKTKFTTTKGDFVIELHRTSSPNPAARFSTPL